jgi:hypothetical protein
MTDLEMTRLAAEAMGLGVGLPHAALMPSAVYISLRSLPSYIYDPLHDDAQAMALVKKCNIEIFRPWDESCWGAWWHRSDDKPEIKVRHHDLNHAIVECVAQIQAAKLSLPSSTLR